MSRRTRIIVIATVVGLAIVAIAPRRLGLHGQRRG